MIVNHTKKKKDDPIVKNVFETIKAIFEEMEFLTIFSVESADQVTELDEAILSGILKAQKKLSEGNEKRLIKSQLNLALTWNRLDVAKSYIFKEDNLLDVSVQVSLIYFGIGY